MTSFIVKTRAVNGTFITNAVKGKRASATSGSAEAAGRLAAKVFPGVTAYVYGTRRSYGRYLISDTEMAHCTNCRGSGEIEYFRCSHDYSETCEKCKGLGVEYDG